MSHQVISAEKAGTNQSYMLILKEVPLQQFSNYISVKASLVYARSLIQPFSTLKKK